MNDAVLFRSDRFSLEPTPEGDKTYDLPLGDDLAAVLRERLLLRKPGLWIDKPIREDWGTVLWVRDGPDEYFINVHWVPDGGLENRWGITFRKLRGFLGWLMRLPAGPAECRVLQQLVAGVLADDSATFQRPEWLAQHEYDARH